MISMPSLTLLLLSLSLTLSLSLPLSLHLHLSLSLRQWAIQYHRMTLSPLRDREIEIEI
jgi:hypothetical protein